MKEEGIRMAGYFDPDVPTIDSFPTLPRLRRSNMVNPTTPTFLSDPEAPPPTKPVVYSPVPTIRTSKGLDPASCLGAGLGSLELCIGIESILSAVNLQVLELKCVNQPVSKSMIAEEQQWKLVGSIAERDAVMGILSLKSHTVFDGVDGKSGGVWRGK